MVIILVHYLINTLINMQTRGLNVIRTVQVEVTNKKGETKMEKRHRLFHVRVNAGVPSDHRMLTTEYPAVLAYMKYKNEGSDS